MNASARTALVAVALVGFVPMVVVLFRAPEPSPARTASVATTSPRQVREAAEAADELPGDEPIPEILPDVPPANPAPASADGIVTDGLSWLEDRQSADGSWHDPATTGLVLLAFLGAGETHQTGSFRATVEDGLEHLRDVQSADGALVPPGSPRALRDHAIAALALVEAYGMTGSRSLEEPARRAVAFASKAPMSAAGWTRPDGRLDFEATVWMSMLLRSARPLRFDIDATALPGAVAAISLTTDWNGRVVPPDAGRSDAAATAMGVLVRTLGDRTPDTDNMVRRGAELLAANPPVWREGRLADPAAWYFGTAVMSSLYREHWKSWANAMVAVLDRAAASGVRGDLRGSWDPPSGSPSEVERVWTTAFVLLGTERAFYSYKVFVK